jgi:hypothetical protein
VSYIARYYDIQRTNIYIQYTRFCISHRDVLKSVNGVILPGGSSQNGPGNPYYDTVSHIYKIAKKVRSRTRFPSRDTVEAVIVAINLIIIFQMNDQGTIFPVLGVCLGYEFMITVANKDKNFLMRCDVNYENLPLKFAVPYTRTTLYSRLNERQRDILSSSGVTVNHHRYIPISFYLFRYRICSVHKDTYRMFFADGARSRKIFRIRI